MTTQYISIRLAKSRGTATLRHNLLIANNKTGNYDTQAINKVFAFDKDGNVSKYAEFQRHAKTRDFTADPNKIKTKQYVIYKDLARHTKAVEQNIRLNHQLPDPITGKKPRKLQKDTKLWWEGIITFGNETQDLKKSDLTEQIENVDNKAQQFISKFAKQENINPQNLILFRHTDELQIHYHFLITLYNEKDRKPIGGSLNKAKLTQLQDLAGNTFADIGFKRGKSKQLRMLESQPIQHKKVDEWMSKISKAQDTTIELARKVKTLQLETGTLANEKASLMIFNRHLSETASIYNKLEKQLLARETNLQTEKQQVAKVQKQLMDKIIQIVKVVRQHIAEPINKLCEIVLEQVFNIKPTPKPEKQLSLKEMLKGIEPEREISR